jgi:UDP-2-acetamido-2-deoxy-ribo-hexuluronate aminotransferase
MKVRYYHDAIGVNSRLDSIQAAVLRIKLRRLNEYNNLRKSAADFYDRAFSSNIHLKVPSRYKKSTHVFHQYTLVTSGIDRFALQDFLLKKDVPAMVYYPVPLHMQKAYLDDRYQEGDFPITEDLCKTVISLPMHTELDEEQLEYIASAVLEFVNKKT